MTKTWYDKKEDILNIELTPGKYWKSIELAEMVIDITKEGIITSIEIAQASKKFASVKEVIEHARPMPA